jgi:hypothetical protein
MEKVQFVQIIVGVVALAGILAFGFVRAYMVSKRSH